MNHVLEGWGAVILVGIVFAFGAALVWVARR